MDWTKATTIGHVLLAEQKPRDLTEQQLSCSESSVLFRLQQSTSPAVTLLTQPPTPCCQYKEREMEKEKFVYLFTLLCFVLPLSYWFMSSSEKTEFGALGAASSKQVTWSVRLNCLGRTSGKASFSTWVNSPLTFRRSNVSWHSCYSKLSGPNNHDTVKNNLKALHHHTGWKQLLIYHESCFLLFSLLIWRLHVRA